MKKKIKRVELLPWMKEGVNVWVELRDNKDQEILEYLEGEITLADFQNYELYVNVYKTNEETEYSAQRVFQRLEDHEVINDLSNIPVLNNPELLKHLEVRFSKELIHCYCGPTLIVINPYTYVDHESNEEKRHHVMKHLLNNTLKQAVPHIWTVAAKCFHQLFQQDYNQSVCISGESGAGKTESSKRFLEFITNMKSESRSMTYVPIEQKILSCNPLLECFGNAKTFRNDNSSRFGKYTVLYLDKLTKHVKGASIENYLLEKSRISKLAKHERNYHIFYCMCRFMNKELQKQYKLLNKDEVCDMKSFRYLNQSPVYVVPKVNDEEFFEDITMSFRDLEFSTEQVDAIWRIVSTVLHLGNVEIDDSEYEEGAKPCTIKDSHAWQCVGELLDINLEDFEEALTHWELRIGTNITKSPLSPLKCLSNIDSIAKELYNKMFSWIVKKLNQTLLPENPQDENLLTIGVLDIFGFEIFEINSIEQFFINYANECLQGLYIQYIFKNECEIFEQEGLGEYTQNIKYTDNSQLLQALSYPKMPPGIFNLIDQSCLLKKDDEKLHSEILKMHKNSAYIMFPRFAKQLSFIVRHTARDVEYLTDGFVEKNKDELSAFLERVVETANKEVVLIFKEISGLKIKLDKNIQIQKDPKEKYLGFKFRRDMQHLVSELGECYCHFVRCIKPNEIKKPFFWNPQLALMQIRYMGLLDSLKVRKESYPFRFDYKKFYQTYQDLDMGENGAKSFLKLERQDADWFALTKELLSHCEVDFTDKDLLYGNNKIFLNEHFKINIDKTLKIKQHEKKQQLDIIERLYISYVKRCNIQEYFTKTARSVIISRELVKEWNAKMEGMKFRNLLKIIRKVQFHYKQLMEKREKRLKAFKMILVTKYLGLVKFTKLLQYSLFYKRKIETLQALFDKKNRFLKYQFVKNQVTNCFKDAMAQVRAKILLDASSQIQRNFRAYAIRKANIDEFLKMKKILRIKAINNSARQLQKAIRGFLVRQKMDRQERGVRFIQGYFRTKWLRGYFLALLDATAMIQRFLKKYYIRKCKLDEAMNGFLAEFRTYNDNVSSLEYNIMFSDKKDYADANVINDYKKLPFNMNNEKMQFGSSNYRKFIPESPEVEVNPKTKLFSMVLDVDVKIDSTNLYTSTWSKQFIEFIEKAHQRNQRFMKLEIGESFSVAITEEKCIYTWGLNDFNQCGTNDLAFSKSVEQIKKFNALKPKMISLGSDHGIIVNQNNNVFTWGKNQDGQLGSGDCKEHSNLLYLSEIQDLVKTVKCQENSNYVLTQSGKVITWPVKEGEEMIYDPTLMEIPSNIRIVNIELGYGFGVFLSSNGLLYSKGENTFGELGVGDFNPREELTLVKTLKSYTEKVYEISAGYKHVICRTSLNKVYTWGLNSQFQLGVGDNESKNVPTKFIIPYIKKNRFLPKSVSAGYCSSFLLMQSNQLFYAGKTGFDRTPYHYGRRYKFESQLFVNNEGFQPLRIQCKWSKVLNVTYMVYLDSRNCSDLISTTMMQKINQAWNLQDNQILPPVNVTTKKYLAEKFLEKRLDKIVPYKIKNKRGEHQSENPKTKMYSSEMRYRSNMKQNQQVSKNQDKINKALKSIKEVKEVSARKYVSQKKPIKKEEPNDFQRILMKKKQNKKLNPYEKQMLRLYMSVKK